MIPVNLISDTQFLRARALPLPVTVLDARTFSCPSATRPELAGRHRVQFDSADEPRRFACTCESFTLSHTACWASARALDVLVLLATHNITVAGRGQGTERSASTDDAGEPSLEGRTPHEVWDGRFECRRGARVPEPEGNAEAVLVAPASRRRVEKVGAFQV